MKMVTAGLCVLLSPLTAHGQALKSTPCESLSSLALPNTSITLAQVVPAGAFTLPAANRATPQLSQLPAFCRVAATLTPSSDSDIKIELWLPLAHWNGKFLAVGNGGLAGTITYDWLAAALQQGYATASTDTGHTGANASFAIGHPEKVVDFAYRAVHEMAVKSQAIVAKFYGRAPRLSYFTGCSTGGRQGLMEAQRYPEDFDGIIAGAPANNQTHLSAWRIAVEAKILQNSASVVPPTKLALLHHAVLAACDALDGVTDGLLTDPRQCHFDPATLLCRGTDRDDCLTAPQVDAVKMGYAPARRTTGELIFPGLVPGGETGWDMLTSAKPEPGSIDVGLFRFVAHEDPAWDWRTFDLDRDTSLIDKKAGFIDAVNPDLWAFRVRGGKLLLYHGWNDGGSDGAISPLSTVNYYASILARMGPSQQDWLRLFMVPGMAHCGGGPGPAQVNWIAALERWREFGVAPDRLIASRVSDNHVNMRRPICSYPAVAKYKGVGNTNDATNFACKVP
ncbi:MAG TPA: tannase/feruloyl esterase family alpha/beta hydrolase [Candidatus Sulfotelmatobacter sp.]|nr:tannase/feruloyl esterase family alpha/beta hydrolase [Candidatus Sulfotelmatobacter sp.]